MAHPPGFDLGAGRLPAPEKPHIEIGDTVRCRASRLLFHVIDVDGEDIYCHGYIDPFSAAGLEIVC